MSELSALVTHAVALGAPVTTFWPEQYPAHVEDPERFLGSRRAVLACSREIDLLIEEITSRVAALTRADAEEAAVVRLSPGRCIVQLGQVALTVAWLLRSADSVVDGELLIVVWRGSVAPRREHCPERHAVPDLAATVEWEQVLTAAARQHDAWRWQVKDAASEVWSSSSVAARCVERLHVAYAHAHPAA